MTLATHIAVSGGVMCVVRDPVGAAAVNMALHPVLDAIPHAEWTTFYNHDRQDLLPAVTLTLIDLIAAGFILRLLYTTLAQPAWLTTVSWLAGLWMDLLQPFVKPFWPGFARFQDFMHSWPVVPQPGQAIDWSRSLTGRTPTWVKLVVQVLLTVLPVLWIIQAR